MMALLLLFTVLLPLLLCRWMAADLYLREVDVLRFEVRAQHNHC
jgi:hypothetical protein